MNAIAILVGTHGFGNELLLIFIFDGVLMVIINGKLVEGLPPGNVGPLGNMLLTFKDEVNALVILCNVLVMLTFATVLSIIREFCVYLIVVRSCLLVLFVEKLDAYLGTLVVGLNINICLFV